MKVAITGISSYLATELLPLLEKDPEITEILGLDIVKPTISSSKITFKKRDVRDISISEDLKGYDVIIHLAFIVSPLKDMKETYSINIDGSKNIFDCAVRAGVQKIIHASSVAAYGSFPDNPIPITEAQPIRLMEKRFYYNETKYLVEKYLDELELKNPDLIITRLRPHVFLGPTINNILKNSFKGDNHYSFLPDELSQYVWSEDVAQAFYLALKKNSHGAFNLGAAKPLTSRELASRLKMKLVKLPYKFTKAMLSFTYKLHIQRKAGPGWLRIMKHPIIVDCDKARNELGWKPKYDDVFDVIRAFITSNK